MAQTSITITINNLGAAETLLLETHRQGPYAMRRAIGDVLTLAQTGVKTDIATTFFLPVTYTQNSTFIVKPTTNNNLGKIAIKDKSNKSTPPGNYMRHHVVNSQRRHTPFENKLRDQKILSDDEYLMPESGADKDSRGNLQQQMLDDILYATTGSGFKRISAARTIIRRITRAQVYFLFDRNGKRGIYKWKDDGIVPVFIFIKRPKAYKDIFRFHELVEDIVAAQINTLFNTRFQEALASAR